MQLETVTFAIFENFRVPRNYRVDPWVCKSGDFEVQNRRFLEIEKGTKTYWNRQKHRFWVKKMSKFRGTFFRIGKSRFLAVFGSKIDRFLGPKIDKMGSWKNQSLVYALVSLKWPIFIKTPILKLQKVAILVKKTGFSGSSKVKSAMCHQNMGGCTEKTTIFRGSEIFKIPTKCRPIFGKNDRFLGQKKRHKKNPKNSTSRGSCLYFIKSAPKRAIFWPPKSRKKRSNFRRFQGFSILDKNRFST